MSDLALRWDPVTLTADFVIEANDLVREEGLETAVWLSLFLDRRAGVGDVLPSDDADRRGWWGDALEADGDQIGSRLWLTEREKNSTLALARAEEYAREALQWLIDDKVADRVDVTASVPMSGTLGIAVVIYRPGQAPAHYRFNHVWAALEG